MRRILLSFLRQFIFWLLFFDLTRLIFIVWHHAILSAEHIRLSEVAGIFFHSLKLDLATATYINILPFLLLVIQSVWSRKWIDTMSRVYSSVMIAAYSLTMAGEMGIYAEWKTKLTYKVLKYFNHPGEIFNSAETGTFYLLLFLFLLVSAAGILAFNRLFYLETAEVKRKPWFTAGFVLITPGLLFITMRGGVQQIPINQSECYYSNHNLLNIAAVNNAFNLYISIFENLSNFGYNPYVFMSREKAEGIMSQLYRPVTAATPSVLTTNRPNVVLIILESWSADLIESLGGEPGITPEFGKLVSGGILFDSIYASGSRSEQGMASIFGGFPAHPVSSITVQPDKFVKLPSLVKVLKQQHYSSAFYFGGQLIYGNIKSYIIFNGFDRITEGADFPGSYPRGKLGVHDGFTLPYLVKDAGSLKQPFLASLFTLSTHSPWDQPFAKPLTWGDNEREYINAAYYTDHCLGEFIRMAKKEPWYPNTLFVFVADHSHNSYRNWHPASREYHRIPMLFYGEVINKEFRGTRCHKLGNQHDLAATLLGQLGLSSGGFRYSKDLLNPSTEEFAYYTTEDGMGWIRPATYFTWDKGPDFYYWWTDPKLPDHVRLEGKAYLQTVFGEYMND